jgi:hypothetical protein
MGFNSVGTMSFTLTGGSDLNTLEDRFAKLIEYLTDFSRNLGTFFEPEQELEFRRVDDTAFSYEVAPVFVCISEDKPEPLFFPYLHIAINGFKALLLGHEFDPVFEVEQLQGALLESESDMLRSFKNAYCKKIDRLKLDVDFSYELSQEECVASSLTGGDPVREERTPVVFQNYEFEYELESLVFSGNKSSRLLIGGRAHDVFFGEDFIEALKEALHCKAAELFERDVRFSYPELTPEKVRIRELSFVKNKLSVVLYQGNDFKMTFSPEFLSTVDSLLRDEIGTTILLKDRFQRRAIGDYYRGEFYETDVRDDCKTCFEFIPRTG